MGSEQTVIYTARGSQEAHLLKNLLAAEQIQATVTNDVLEKGAGVDYVGWSTAPRVLVAAEDASHARIIALEFDRRAAEMARQAGLENTMEDTVSVEKPQESMVGDAWPCCPQCDAPRSTQCPICGTSGHDFQWADMGFVLMRHPGESEATATSCGCGSGRCHSSDETSEATGEEDYESAEPVRTLMCPMCDEPFEPEYGSRCTQCGHLFPDGYPMAPIEDVGTDEINPRMILVTVGLVALTVAAAGYFLFLV